MTKTTGAEWKRFYDDPDFWQPGVYHEDEEVTSNGEPIDSTTVDLGEIPDDTVLTVSGGDVRTSDGTSVRSLEQHFKLWLKGQTKGSFVVEFDKTKEAALREAIRQAGGKIL